MTDATNIIIMPSLTTSNPTEPTMNQSDVSLVDMCDGIPCLFTTNYPQIPSSQQDVDPTQKPASVYDRNGPYWLVPPFFISASVITFIYILAHCIYFHCYTRKKMKRLSSSSARHFPPAIVIHDDPTSTGSYHMYTPVLKYNEQGEVVEAPNVFLYQPFDDDEWERQLALRRHSSVKSSFKSSSGRGGGRKKSVTLHIPTPFGRKRESVCSASEVLDKIKTEAGTQGKQRRGSVCFVPAARSRSEPAENDEVWVTVPGIVYTPMVLQRSQSCKVTSHSKKNKTTENLQQANGTRNIPLIVIADTETQNEEEDKSEEV